MSGLGASTRWQDASDHQWLLFHTPLLTDESESCKYSLIHCKNGFEIHRPMQLIGSTGLFRQRLIITTGKRSSSGAVRVWFQIVFEGGRIHSKASTAFWPGECLRGGKTSNSTDVEGGCSFAVSGVYGNKLDISFDPVGLRVFCEKG